MGSSSQGIQKMLFLFCLVLLQIVAVNGQSTEPAVRVVRFQVDYPEAELDTVRKLPNWVAVMRKRLTRQFLRFNCMNSSVFLLPCVSLTNVRKTLDDAKI